MAVIYNGENSDPGQVLGIYSDTIAAIEQAARWAVPGHPITVVVPDVIPGYNTKITVSKEPARAGAL